MWGSTKSSTYLPSPVKSVGSSRRRTAFPKIEVDAAMRHPSRADWRSSATITTTARGSYVKDLSYISDEGSSIPRSRRNAANRSLRVAPEERVEHVPGVVPDFLGL